VERIIELNPISGEIHSEPETVSIYPAKHYLTSDDKLREAVTDIETELQARIAYYKATISFSKPNASNNARCMIWKCCAR
jgi:excinuclease ABC subunit B